MWLGYPSWAKGKGAINGEHWCCYPGEGTFPVWQWPAWGISRWDSIWWLYYWGQMSMVSQNQDNPTGCWDQELLSGIGWSVLFPNTKTKSWLLASDPRQPLPEEIQHLSTFVDCQCLKTQCGLLTLTHWKHFIKTISYETFCQRCSLIYALVNTSIYDLF